METRRTVILTALLVSLLLLSGVPLALLPSASAEDDYTGPWSEPVRMDSGKHVGMTIDSLRLVQSPEGAYHASWMDERSEGTDTFSTTSIDGGGTWSLDLRIDPYANQVRKTPTTCDIEVDKDGLVYVSYTQWMLQQGWWRIRFARSDDGGGSFRDPSDAFFVVDDGIAQEHPATAVSTHGALNIVYLERTQTSSKLFSVRSDDGLNPLPPRVIEPGMPDNETHVQGDIVLDEDNNVYIAFGYRAPGEAGIKLARAQAGSGTFTVSKVWSIVEDEPRSLRPRIQVEGDVVEIVFDPLKAEGRFYHVRSDDGGETFSAASKVWAGGGSGEKQTDPTLAFDAMGRIHMAWAQGPPGNTWVYHSLSADGVTFTAPTQLTGGWNESEMGPRLWENNPAILPQADGSVAAAFVANLNNTVGVYFTKMENLPPVVDITSPADGAQVRGTVYIQGTAVDPSGTTGLSAIYVQVNDEDPKRLPGTTEWEHSFDSTQYLDGLVNVTAWAFDGFVKGPVDSITVDVDNNNPPTFNVAKPINGTSYVGAVPVVGTAQDEEGFSNDSTVQWRLLGKEDWIDSMGWEPQTENIMDFDFDLYLAYLPTGPHGIEVRVSDGDKFSSIEERTFDMENKPDLVIDPAWISIDLDQPEHRDVVTISVTVKNQGAGSSGRYDVEFRRFNNFEGMTIGSNLSVGESDTLVFVWEAVKGDNTLRFIVDPQFKIPELDKDNNEAQIEVKVKAPPKDEEEESNWMFIIAIVVIVAVAGIGGALIALKYWASAPALAEPEVQVVYEEGGMYSEGGGEYSGADTSGRELEEAQDPNSQEDRPRPPKGGTGGGPDATADPEWEPPEWMDDGTVEAEKSGQTTDGTAGPMEGPQGEPGGDIDLDHPEMDSKSSKPLEQDVDIRTEKVDRE